MKRIYVMCLNFILSYDVAVVQWITSCYKTLYGHICNNTKAQTRNVIDNVRVNNAFLIEIMFNLKAIKSHFKGSYDKQNLTLVVISSEIYETRRRLVSLSSYDMTTRVRSSISSI